MLKKTVFILILFFCFLAGLSAADDRGLDVIIRNLTGNDYTVPGKQYALFIAVNKYKEWMALKNPVKDAREIRDILINRYYVDDVIEVYDDNATKAGINRAFIQLIENTKPEDSVFIFYAGHGHMDDMSNTAFWIPVDGGNDAVAQENWIPSAQIRGFITKMKARRIALFADSCFSGDILNPTRSITPSIDNAYFKNAYNRVSRQVLTSGASETVPDASEFAMQLKMVLEGNNQPYLDPLMIYSEVRLGLTKTTPLFGSLAGAGHQDGGSFLFFLKQPEAAAAEKPAPEENPELIEVAANKPETLPAAEKPPAGKPAAEVEKPAAPAETAAAPNPEEGKDKATSVQKPTIKLQPWSAKKIAAVTTFGAGSAALGTGAVFVISAILSKTNIVDPALAAYQSAPNDYQGDFTSLTVDEKTAYFDSLWNTYNTSFDDFRGRLIAGIVTGASGVAVLGASILLFALPEKKSAADGKPDLLAYPMVNGFGINLKY